MTTTTTPTQARPHQLAARFLRVLAGGRASDPGELLELRYRVGDGQRMGQLFEPADRARGLATRALALGRRTDVYVGCAPRVRRHGGRRAIERGYVLWADCDGEQAVAALQAFEPAPSIVIASGSGSNCHAYWPLQEPLDRDELEHANRRLAHALGADPASADAARILRVPGTLSHKHAPPTAVEAIRTDFERRLAVADVVGELPELPRPARTPAAPHPARADDPLLRDRARGLRRPAARRRDPAPSQGALPVPRRPHGEPARLRDRGARLVLLRPLPPRRHHLRPRRPLYGYDPRGEDFLRLRADLGRLFGLETIA